MPAKYNIFCFIVTLPGRESNASHDFEALLAKFMSMTYYLFSRGSFRFNPLRGPSQMPRAPECLRCEEGFQSEEPNERFTPSIGPCGLGYRIACPTFVTINR